MAEDAYVTAVDAVASLKSGVIPDARKTERRGILWELLVGALVPTCPEALVTRPRLLVCLEAAETTREDVAERACISDLGLGKVRLGEGGFGVSLDRSAFPGKGGWACRSIPTWGRDQMTRDLENSERGTRKE